MNYKELTKRYLTMLIGILVLCFGIAFVTKADLGTSPISSIPYTMSMILSGFTMGNFTAMINILLIIFEWMLLRNKTGADVGRGSAKAVTWTELAIQFVLSFAMGAGIDLSMAVLVNLHPTVYWMKLIFAVVGCAIMALGVYIQLSANVAMAAGDAFARAITVASGKPYNVMRTISDASMVAIAAILCIVFLGNLAGVREGTVICALMTGNFVKLYKKLFVRWVDKFFDSNNNK